MISRKHLCSLLALFSLMMAVDAQAQSNSQANRQAPPKQATSNPNAPYEILKRNEIDDTDVLAIPLDDSEVEDEEEINQLRRREVFPLPHSR